jgi:hypothetical protein
MSLSTFKAIFVVVFTITGFLFSANKLSAATVILNFESLSSSIRTHGPSISMAGYTLSANVIESIKPTDAVSNGTTSIFTQNTYPLTITKGLSNDQIFSLISVDLDEIFSSGTPIVKISGVKSNNAIVTSQFVAGGITITWVPLPNLFINLVSLTFSHNAPFLYHLDNIVLQSTDVSQLSSVPLPATAPLYATGLMALGLALYKRRNKIKNKQYS